MNRMLRLMLVVILAMLGIISLQAQDDAVVITDATIADIAISNPDFSILVQAVQAADPAVLAALADPNQQLTVFAPTNQAFLNLASELQITPEELLQSPYLTDILLYHVVSGVVTSDAVLGLDGVSVDTLLEGNSFGVTINDDGSVVLNDVVEVIDTDIMAANGVIHVINDVILPAYIFEAFNLEVNTNVRFLHLSPDAPAVDIYLDGFLIAEGAAYTQSTEYLTIETGAHVVAVAPTGAGLDAAVLGPIEVILPEGAFWNIAAIGSAIEGTLNVAIFEQEFSPLEVNEFGVTYFHAVEGAGDVDVYVNGTPNLIGLGYPLTQLNEEGDYNDGSLTTVYTTDTITELGIYADDALVLPIGTEGFVAGNYYLVAAVPGDAGVDGLVLETTAVEADRLNNALVTPLDDINDDSDMDGDDMDMNGTDDGMDMMGQTIADVVVTSASSATPEFTILLAALQNADPVLLEAASDPNTALTVFAPTDQAFANLLVTLNTDAESLLISPLLTEILSYHIAASDLYSNDLGALETLAMLGGGGITFNIDTQGNLLINDVVRVITADIVTDNGVIHVIDNVLLPPSALQAFGLD